MHGAVNNTPRYKHIYSFAHDGVVKCASAQPKQDDGKNNDGKEKKEQQQPQQGKGQLSPQQIQNLLETMANQEAKVQEKLNAKKAKAAKVKTEKDW